MAHFEHGAVDKTSKHLTDPMAATKRTIYECPGCAKDVFVRKGAIKVAHFAHRADKLNPCTYYNRNPTADQRHRNAQLKLKHFLELGREITIGRLCMCGCRWVSNFGITYLPSNIVKCEHRFDFNGSKKSADVAVLNSNGAIVCIFEVVHTHYTQERDRPDPWHEVKADEINAIPSDAIDIVLTCIRQKTRPECIVKQEEERKRIAEDRVIQEQRWKEERIQREKEQKYRDDYHAEMEKQWIAQQHVRARKLAEEREMHQQLEREQKERNRLAMEERRAKDEKERERKEDLYRQRRLLFKKHADTIARCEQCGPMAAWLNAGNSVGRCRKCEKLIDELVNEELNTMSSNTGPKHSE